jgi:putative flippase GtrA
MAIGCINTIMGWFFFVIVHNICQPYGVPLWIQSAIAVEMNILQAFWALRLCVFHESGSWMAPCIRFHAGMAITGALTILLTAALAWMGMSTVMASGIAILTSAVVSYLVTTCWVFPGTTTIDKTKDNPQ